MKAGKLFLVLATVVTFMVSCKKEEDQNKLKRSAVDFAIGENLFNDVFSQSSNAVIKAQDSASGKKSMYDVLASCATITITPFDLTTFPKTIVVDFGTTNCLCNDGRYRRGKLNIVTTGWFRDSGTVVTITPQDYYVNNNKVEGQKTITNKGRNTVGHLNYDIVVHGTISTSEGTISWNCVRNHEWIEGDSTIFNPWDDVFLIRGEAWGTNIHGEDYQVVVINPLRIARSCRWVTAGVLRITSGGHVLDINYGDGNCDGTVVITLDQTNTSTYVVP
jgi:hypothetical protein